MHGWMIAVIVVVVIVVLLTCCIRYLKKKIRNKIIDTGSDLIKNTTGKILNEETANKVNDVTNAAAEIIKGGNSNLLTTVAKKGISKLQDIKKADNTKQGVFNMNQNKAQEYKDSGNQNLNKGNYDQAITDFTQAIKLNPNDVEVYSGRGTAYNGKGITCKDATSLDLAIEDFNRALKLNPDFASVYTALGVAYLGKREYDKAFENCNRAIQLNPEDYAAYSGRGGIYIIKDEYERGIKDMETSLRLNPDQPDIRNQLEMVRNMQKMQR